MISLECCFFSRLYLETVECVSRVRGFLAAKITLADAVDDLFVLDERALVELLIYIQLACEEPQPGEVHTFVRLLGQSVEIAHALEEVL